jgi:hypothetical protein
MTARSAVHPRRLFDLLASLRLGVVAMVVLAVACGIATFYESSHGTAAAQRMFYQTSWFTFLLALLAVNILLSMLKRYPWSRHQAGFVMAHVGIVLLLTGSLVSLHLGLDGTVRLYEGQGTKSLALQERALAVEVAGRQASFTVPFDTTPPRPGRPVRYAVPGTPVSLVAEDFAAHVAVRETIEAAADGVPAVAFTVDSPQGGEKGWLLAAQGREHVHVGPLHLGLQVAATEPEAQAALRPSAEEGSQLVFVVGPASRLRYALGRAGESPVVGEATVGRPIATPWMDLKVTAEQVLPHAIVRRRVAPAAAPDREEGRLPAVRVRFDSPEGGTASEWVPWGESLGADLAEGAAIVSFGERQAELPFAITLLDFEKKTYPGSNMPASYESRVRVQERDGTPSLHLIAMNHPLHHRGYVFFQASFVEGQPMMSILSVSRSPGLPLVYLGTALVSLGVAWMFYVKPWLGRRQARRAARRRQEWTGPAAEVAS